MQAEFFRYEVLIKSESYLLKRQFLLLIIKLTQCLASKLSKKSYPCIITFFEPT